MSRRRFTTGFLAVGLLSSALAFTGGKNISTARAEANCEAKVNVGNPTTAAQRDQIVNALYKERAKHDGESDEAKCARAAIDKAIAELNAIKFVN
jgi:hypothetical protein